MTFSIAATRRRYFFGMDGDTRNVPPLRFRQKSAQKNSESEDSKFFEICYAGSSSVSDFLGERALRILFPCSCHFTQSELATQMDE